MAWDELPLVIGDVISNTAAWHELIDAINERATWAGVATVAAPSTGSVWLTAEKVRDLEEKIEELIPFFTNPTPTISKDQVIFTKWNFASIFGRFSWSDWTRYIDGNFTPGGLAATGDNSSKTRPYPYFHYLGQMWQILNALRYTTKTVSWASDDQDLRWISNRSYRIFVPPLSSGGVLGESAAQDYVEDHWASGAWWDLSSGIPPVPNTVNGAYLAMLNLSFYEFDDSMKWGEARWIRDSSGVDGPEMVVGGGPFDPTGLVTPPDDAAEIELMRARNRLTGGIVSGSAVEIFGYQVPHVHGADYLQGEQNETTATGDAEKISIATDHTSGTLVASGLGYDDTRPTPTPALSDIGGGYPARMDETYYELNAEVLIELDFDKMT